MGKKHTYTFVKEQIEKEDYILLSKEYKNNSIKLDYICPLEHKHSTTWGSWVSGYRCPGCGGSMKLTIDFVRKEFEKEGYTLLDTIYINANTKLKYKCSQGHEQTVTWSGFKQGARCDYCNKNVIYDKVKKAFEKENYKLISKEYINSSTKLEYVCPNNHRHSIRWNDFQQGGRCLYCSKRPIITYEHVLESFKKENYILLATEYINNNFKMPYICPNGHKRSVTWGNWKNGYRCKICASASTSRSQWKGGVSKKQLPLYNTYSNQLSWIEDTKKYIDKDGLELLQVRGAYCSKWLVPTINMVTGRLYELKKSSSKELRFYCSDGCKKACPIFGTRKWPKGFKKDTSREVQPELRKMVFERDGWACLKCGKTTNEVELHCHHITGVVQNPIESADMDNCITLCKEHHKEVHKQKGCTYYDLKCNPMNKELL